MAFTDIEQLKKVIEDKKHILIVFSTEGKGDSIGCAIALRLFLEQMNKRSDIVRSGFNLPESYKFLKGSEQIKDSIGNLQKFIILVDAEKTGIGELSYDVKDEKLRIFITSKEGSIAKEDISTMQSEFKYDLIISLDSPDMASLGTVYENNVEFFLKTPIVNIDHKPNNERFGSINIIDMTASTTSEVVYGIMRKIGGENISADAANALLTGMIAGTNSFKKHNVRPSTLLMASELVSAGADRGNIIKNLYQTKSIATFRLWGSVLSHLQHEYSIGLVWSTITRDDFARSGANENDLPPIIDELISNSSAAQFILLLYERQIEREHDIKGLFQIKKSGYDALEILSTYKPEGEKNNVSFKIIGGKTLKEAEDEVIAAIKEKINGVIRNF